MTRPLGALGQADIYSDAAKLRTLLAACRVRVYNNANILIANDAWTTLTFNSERWDVGAMHSTVANTDRLTCTVPGLYDIKGQVEFAAGGNYRMMRILLNGATTLVVNSNLYVTTWAHQFTVSTPYELQANDYVTLQVYQNSGGNLNVNYQAQYSPEFMMARIG